MNKDACPLCTHTPLEDRASVSRISWLQCDVCSQWFHAPCLALTAASVAEIHSFHCDDCAPAHGPSVPRRTSKRVKVLVDYLALHSGDVFAVDKSLHPHAARFRDFPVVVSPADPHNLIDVCDSLDRVLVLKRVIRPILLASADLGTLGMRLPVPPKDLTVPYIADRVGEGSLVEVMDVLLQQGVHPRWNMLQWRDYFCGDASDRDRIRNVISLEISQVPGLGPRFCRPSSVRLTDLVDRVWGPCAEIEACARSLEKPLLAKSGSTLETTGPSKQTITPEPRPAVTKYCLMSVQGSFTDFHIDFGGTLVYYTVISGAKTFLMFPPTPENLDVYLSWCLESAQNYIWLPEYRGRASKTRGKPLMVSGGFKVSLRAGDVFMIPSGWIHAVYTPSDSVVLGGNYLTLADMETQLRVARLERETKVPAKFRFPDFYKLMWFTGWFYMHHTDMAYHDLGLARANANCEPPADVVQSNESCDLQIDNNCELTPNLQCERSADITCKRPASVICESSNRIDCGTFANVKCETSGSIKGEAFSNDNCDSSHNVNSGPPPNVKCELPPPAKCETPSNVKCERPSNDKPAIDTPPSTVNARRIFLLLAEFLEWHHDFSKTNSAARKSIPTAVIGKDVPLFLQEFRQWSEKL